jgi:hypothetical protein
MCRTPSRAGLLVDRSRYLAARKVVGVLLALGSTGDGETTFRREIVSENG